MKISTRGRYGLRALVELARHYGKRPVEMGRIAKREEVSRKYLHALFTSLKSTGLIRGVRGSGGGYVLVKEPSKVTLWEVLNVLEGSLSLVPCVEDKSFCKRARSCVARETWERLSKAMESHLSKVTLSDLVGRKKGGELHRSGLKICMQASLGKGEVFERGGGI